jgi:hypothetical protein
MCGGRHCQQLVLEGGKLIRKRWVEACNTKISLLVLEGGSCNINCSRLVVGGRGQHQHPTVLSGWLVGGRPQQQLSPDAGADALGPHQMNNARMLLRCLANFSIDLGFFTKSGQWATKYCMLSDVVGIGTATFCVKK